MAPIPQPPGAAGHPTLPPKVGCPSEAVRQTGSGEGPQVQPLLAPSPDQRTAGQVPTPLSLPSQTRSPDHPSRCIPGPLGHPSSGQHPPRRPSTSSVTCKPPNAS